MLWLNFSPNSDCWHRQEYLPFIWGWFYSCCFFYCGAEKHCQVHCCYTHFGRSTVCPFMCTLFMVCLFMTLLLFVSWALPWGCFAFLLIVLTKQPAMRNCHQGAFTERDRGSSVPARLNSRRVQESIPVQLASWWQGQSACRGGCWSVVWIAIIKEMGLACSLCTDFTERLADFTYGFL